MAKGQSKARRTDSNRVNLEDISGYIDDEDNDEGEDIKESELEGWHFPGDIKEQLADEESPRSGPTLREVPWFVFSAFVGLTAIATVVFLAIAVGMAVVWAIGEVHEFLFFGK